MSAETTDPSQNRGATASAMCDAKPTPNLFARARPMALWAPILAVALCWPAVAPSAEDAASLPLRKAGLWQVKTTMDEAGNQHEQSFKICIDASMELQTARTSTQDHQENCSRYEMKRESDATVVEADCVFNQAAVQSRTEMSGDFLANFHIKIESTTTPPARGEQSAIPIKRVIDQDGSYLGSDCAGLQPGEAMGDDGTKVMVQ